MKSAVRPQAPLSPAPSGGRFFCGTGTTRTASSVWGARKRNQNLPGMGGVYNTINLHMYHYAGNNPVKYIDSDGNYFGFEKRAKQVYSTAHIPRGTSFEDWLKGNTMGEISPKVALEITSVSRTIAVTKLGKTDPNEIKSYAENEVKRYQAFSRVRGQDISTYGLAKDILTLADHAARDARDPRETRGMTRAQIEEKADAAANKVIDDFIQKYDNTYVPPLQQETEQK